MGPQSVSNWKQYDKLIYEMKITIKHNQSIKPSQYSSRVLENNVSIEGWPKGLG